MLPKPTRAKPRGRPCCPNHGEPLEGLPTPMPSKGEGMCPISGYMFDYEVEIDEDESNAVNELDGRGGVRKVLGSKWHIKGDETKKPRVK